MLKIKLDTTHANKVTKCFRSKIFLNSIDIIQILILVANAKFYIVNTPIPFRLYLKNMNIIGIYLNNITNQLIC